MKVPGVMWTALLVGLPLLAGWFGDYFPGSPWALALAGLLLVIAKTIEVVRSGKELPPIVETHEVHREGQPTATPEVQREPPLRTWLWG